LKIKDMIDFNDLPTTEWDKLFVVAMDIMKNSEKYIDACKGKILATCFWSRHPYHVFLFRALCCVSAQGDRLF
jgi:aspartate carbamoyltransferase catalytic subunit